MRQSDFRGGVTKNRRNELTLIATAAFVCKTPSEVGWVGLGEAWREDGHVQRLLMRQKHIRTKSFNINVLNNLEFVTIFRFKKQPIGIFCKTMGWKTGKSLKKTTNATPLQCAV